VQKGLKKSTQGFIGIGAGGLFYLVDCVIAHPRHPEISWLRSGLYNWGPFGIFLSILCVMAGVYCLLSED
jgi:hypothetical protein